MLPAFLPEDEPALRLAGRRERFTERTIIGRRELEKELGLVREHGYATAVDEMEFGLTAVAAPIRNASREVVVSLSASGPSFRLPEDRIPEIAEAVIRAATEISHRLGCPS